MNQDFEIKHPPKIVSFAYTDNDTKDLFTYYFHVINGQINLHSIDKFAKKGNSYKKEEIYHHLYRKSITNYETGDFEEPIVPEDVFKAANYFFAGYVVYNVAI
jgi:hypothetical protein